MFRRIRAYLPYVLVLAFALWCAWSVRGDLTQISPAALASSWDLVLLASLLSLLNYVLRIVRWRTYLAQLGHPVGLRFAALTFAAGFAYTVSPGKVGEMVRARYYVPLGVPIRNTTAAFFVERLMDLVAMIVLASTYFTVSSGYAGALIAAGLLVVAVFVALKVMPWHALATHLRSSRRVPEVLRRPVSGVAFALAGTRTLIRPSLLLSGFLLGLMAWGLEGAGLGILSSMFPLHHVSLSTAVGIYGLAVLLGSLSFLPGGLGGTEAIMAALLHSHGLPVGDAVLVTLTCRLVTLWLAVAIGWLAVLALRRPQSPAMAAPWR
jgi:uncharacterized protein (TIRG00374 family)